MVVGSGSCIINEYSYWWKDVVVRELDEVMCIFESSLIYGFSEMWLVFGILFFVFFRVWFIWGGILVFVGGFGSIDVGIFYGWILNIDVGVCFFVN